MSGPFESACPHLAAWVQDGWIELGRDDFSRSFIRVLDIGGLIWEGAARYASVDEALADAEQAAAVWFEENS